MNCLIPGKSLNIYIHGLNLNVITYVVFHLKATLSQDGRLLA